MSQEQTFTAGEAATITTVTSGTQLEWRRRGFLPSNDGKWTRFTRRDLCRLRLLKAITDHPNSIGSTVEHLTEELLDCMESMLAAKLEDTGAPPVYSEMLAVIAFGRKGYKYSVVFNFADVQLLHCSDGVFDFTTMMVINLAALGRQMAEKINSVPLDLEDIDRRIAAVHRNATKHGA